LGFGPSALLLIGILTLSSCGRNKKNVHGAHEDLSVVHIDSNLSHLLKPSNEQVVSSLPLIKAEYGTKIFTEEVQGVVGYDTRNQGSISSRVSGRIERLLIKYNYQPVRKGQLVMEIYSPDLAAAQQELLYLKRSDGDERMLERAKQRLMLLGMSGGAINQVLATGKVNYRIPVYSHLDGYILEKSAAAASQASPLSPAASSSSSSSSAGDEMDNMGGGSSSPAASVASPGSASPANTPVLLREGQYVNAGQVIFTVYNAERLIAEFSLKPALAALLKKGHRFAFYKTADKQSIQNAEIGMIQPVFKNGENFTIARAYLDNPEFRVGELLIARIPVLLKSSWWLPESAVVSLGNQSLVFRKEGNVVVPKAVKTGIVLSGMVQVHDDISNWMLSKDAAYLVDSESFIKTNQTTP